MGAMFVVAVAVVSHLQGAVLAGHESRAAVGHGTERQRRQSGQLARLRQRQFGGKPGATSPQAFNNSQRRGVVSGNARARLRQSATFVGKRKLGEVAHGDRKALAHPSVQPGVIALAANLVKHRHKALLSHDFEEFARRLKVNNVEVDALSSSLAHDICILGPPNEGAKLTALAQACSPPFRPPRRARRSS